MWGWFTIGRRGVILGVVVRIGDELLSLLVKTVVGDVVFFAAGAPRPRACSSLCVLIRVVGGVLCVIYKDSRAYCFWRVVAGRILRVLHVGRDDASWLVYVWVWE